MAKKKENNFIKNVKMEIPQEMDFYINLGNEKEKQKFIARVEKIVRSSMEYKDYIQYLKENVGLDSCVFFQQVGGKNKSKRISIEMHHEPFTLYDIVATVLSKFQYEGREYNELLIADEVLALHYENKVGLVPLSKTMHQLVHNSSKLLIPLNMVYGNYASFLEEYEDALSVNEDLHDMLYDKLQRKIEMTKGLTEESFDAIKKEFTYIDVNGFEDIENVENVEKEESSVA